MSNKASRRVIEDIARSVHSTTSSTTSSLARNKACVGIASSDETPNLKAEEKAKSAEEN